jgi:hypothetical protein
MMNLPASVLVRRQRRTYGPKPISGWGEGALIKAEVRYDDECGNGHNSFSITGTIYIPGNRDIEAGGCLHEEIAKAFPELQPYIKWHLCGSDKPMHYVANTLYHAGDTDYRGLRKGERLQLRNGHTKEPVWQIVVRDDAGNEVFTGSSSWRDAEQKPETKFTAEWEPVWITGEGKRRDLDAARNCAIWPEATDEELTAPGLKERLEARLPKLMEDFKIAVESLGFTY